MPPWPSTIGSGKPVVPLNRPPTAGGRKATRPAPAGGGITGEQFSVPGQAPGAGWNFTWGIDSHGNVSSLSDPWGAMNYAPNALGEPTQVSGYATGVSYHPNGAVAGHTLAISVVRSVSLNTRGLPAQWQDGGVLNDAYTYDANGNVTGIQDVLQGVSPRSMGYDGLDRLTVANGTWGNGVFGYDALDNLTSSQVGARSLNHNIDSATNRLNSLSGSQGVAMGYDTNGNLSSRGAQGYSFDIANRMRSAWGKATYDYDGHGRRGWLVFADGSTQLNAYSGTGAAGTLRFSGHSVKGNTRYVYLGDKLIAEANSQTGTTFSHTDALGSPVAHTNIAGQIIGNRTRYEPYGATAAGDVPQSIGFTGHVNDADTGLVYMQQRYYDPVAGRFLSVDPVVTDAKTGDHFNRYVYANNNPFKYTDPDGQIPMLALFAIGAAQGAIGAMRDPNASTKSILAGAVGGGVSGLMGGMAIVAKTLAASVTQSFVAGTMGNTAGQVIGSVASPGGPKPPDPVQSLVQGGLSAAGGGAGHAVAAAVRGASTAAQTSSATATASTAVTAVSNAFVPASSGGMAAQKPAPPPPPVEKKNSGN